MERNPLQMLWLLITFFSRMTSGNPLSMAGKESSEFLPLDAKLFKEIEDERVMVCYYGSWAVYRPDEGRFDVEDIDPHICTHLIYGFAGLNPSTYEIVSLDPWNDLYDNYGKGAYLRFTRLKKLNPELKTLLAIGGWNEGSSKYSQMAETSTTRKTFIKSCVDFLHKYGFDGLDIDWEYPTLRGGQPQDKVNFGHLLDEMRLEFDKQGLMITSAVSAGKITIDAAYDVGALVRNLDLIQLMAYDFHGTWESYAHHHSPMYAHELDEGDNALLNMDWAVKYWLKIGVPPGKLVVGIGLYGRCFTLASAVQNNVYASAPQPGLPGPYTREPGVLGYNEICEQQLSQSDRKESFKRTEESEERKENEDNGHNEENKEAENNNNTDENVPRRIKRDVFYVERKDIEDNNEIRHSLHMNLSDSTTSHEYKGIQTNQANILKETRKAEERELKSGRSSNKKNAEENNEDEEGRDDAEKRNNEDKEIGGWTIVRDKNMISPYAYKERQWCGYDDVESVAIKAEYIVSLGLAGAMVWSIETDGFHGICNHTQPFPLITTIRTILRDGKPIPTPTPAPTTTTTIDPNATTTTTTETTATTTVTTTTTTKPSPTPAPSSVCHREGLNADPERDCTVFYNCHAVDGKWTVYLFHCAPGTIFVESLQGCDFPEGHALECKILKTESRDDNYLRQQNQRQHGSFNERPVTIPFLEAGTSENVIHNEENTIRGSLLQTSPEYKIIGMEVLRENVKRVSIQEDEERPKKTEKFVSYRKWLKALQFLAKEN